MHVPNVLERSQQDLLEGRRLKLSAELNRAAKLAEEREAAPAEVKFRAVHTTDESLGFLCLDAPCEYFSGCSDLCHR